MKTEQELLAARAKAVADQDYAEQHRINGRLYYVRHKAKVQAKVAQWKEENKEKTMAGTKEWQRKNRMRCAAHAKRWRAKNPERMKKYAQTAQDDPQTTIRGVCSGRVRLFHQYGKQQVTGQGKPSTRGMKRKLSCQNLCGCTEAELYRYLGEVPAGGCIGLVRHANQFNMTDPLQLRACLHFSNLCIVAGGVTRQHTGRHITVVPIDEA